MLLKVKQLTPLASLPAQASSGAAGFDLCAALPEALHLPAGETRLIPCGFAMAVPEGYFAAVFARSGLSTKEGLRPANCVGVIDSDYRGEVKVPLHNDSGEERTVEPGQRIAQMVLLPCPKVRIECCEELDETERGSGGFGSTGQ